MLSRQIAEDETEKYYYAIVCGQGYEKQGDLEDCLLKSSSDSYNLCFPASLHSNGFLLMIPQFCRHKSNLKPIADAPLGLGADDYMTKPFSPSELVARVKAHMARYDRLVGSSQKVNDIIEIRGLKINKTARRVYV